MRFDAVFGGDDKDGKVGDARSATAHFLESFVTGRVDESYFFCFSAFDFVFYFVRRNFLRYTADFGVHDVGLSNIVDEC